MTRRFRDILIVSSSVLAAWAALAGAPFSRAEDGEAVQVPAETDSSSVQVETFRTHSRLRLQLDEGVASQLHSTPQGFELDLKGVGFGDLGAPLGEEQQWASRFKSLDDPRLASLEFAEVQGGLQIRGRWRYPHGPEALVNPVMESFDYRERARSALVIDFWVKEGRTVGQVKARRDANRRIASVKKREDDLKARNDRRVALEKARAEAEDPRSFCRAPLSDKTDVFLRFLPVHEPVFFARWFSPVSPDADYSYYEPEGSERDAQYVRLALKLYREGNFALANRTIDFFEQETPRSQFRAEMRFLRANALLKLGMNQEANQLLRELQREGKASAIALQSGMFLALKEMEAKNYLGALEVFSWLADHQAGNRQAWLIHLGAAEAARALKQTDRAAQEYQWVAEHAPEATDQAEGALRIGDLYLDRFQYDQALAAYAQALRHFQKQADAFPPVHINRADSLYELGQLDRAAEAYREFLTRYPSHPAGWRAAYRLGEIAARGQGAPNRESPAAVNWYLETINRYPFSSGALLARLQLLPCGDHAGLTSEAADHLFATDAEAFDGQGEVVMERYKDFRALARVRSLMTFGKEQEAVAKAVEELRRVARPEARHWLGHLLVFNFRRSVMDLLDAGKKLEALTFYQKNVDTVPVADGTVDPEYLLKLSQAASDLSLGNLAESIGTVFERARKSRESVGRALASDEPQAALDPNADPDRKLQASERAFTEAKALWIANGMKAADRMRALLGQVAPESRFSYERELLFGLLDEKGGDAKSALRHAAQAQLLGPHDTRVDAWVASLEAQAGSPSVALATYRALESDTSSDRAPAAAGNKASVGAAELLGVPPVPERATLILVQSEILEKQGRWGESAVNYERAVGKGLGGTEARYNYARALLKAGGESNHSKAVAELEKIAGEQPGAHPAQAGEQDKFWRRLAGETLADEKSKNTAREGVKQ